MRKKLSALGTNLFVYLSSFFFLFPILWLVSTAFKNRVDAFALPPKWLFVPILDNFKKVFFAGEFMGSYINSVIIAVCTTLLSLLLGIPMAYALARYPIKNKTGIQMWILSTKMAPVMMVAIPFYLIYREIGLIDTYAGMVIVYLLFNLAFTTWMMKGFFEGIPVELEESTRVEGATRLTALFRVVLPLTKGGIAATGIICFINAWNEFMLALILTSSRVKTTPVAITSFISFEGIRWGEIAAAGVLVALPVVVMGILVRKHLVSGMTMGAVKS